MTPQQIQALRRALKEDTKTFGARFGRSWRTVQEWEQGRRSPGTDVMVLIEHLMAKSAPKQRRGRLSLSTAVRMLNNICADD